mmetsp:Transcript_49998/g.140147  ORF Transcript_49998/g.140147 Transcript_49998/m.140147 type:complete len:391 (-) Transcript_49998:144-1316(-)|eukprot:CAMPEP_0117556736 /NCGR_PEP_ID=MMETSP0784-20121206/51963_1 /TAXON_ID=39447 /ORGANISM="" /LENGTH=390 /DNA_ID=CAMNT_0005354021 /DNA_START=48 /DNA_END=1220 /DNA_ORIENTATION=+
MGSGSSVAVSAALKTASEDEVKAAFAELPADCRKRIQEAWAAVQNQAPEVSTEVVRRDVKDRGWIERSEIEELLESPLKILSAVDGTDCSLCAFEYVVRELAQHDSTSTLRVMHLYDDSKDYLPPKFRKKHLESFCDSLCTPHLRHDRYCLKMEPRTPGENVGIRLAQEAADWGADFLVMGFYGRKGKKETSEKLLASNVMEIIQRGKCTSVVMQVDDATAVPHSRPVKFVVSVSLNPAATKAFVDALKLSKPEDEIHAVYIVQHDESAEAKGVQTLRKKYSGLFAGLADGNDEVLSKFGGRTAVFHLVKKMPGDSTAQAVVRYADSIDADFVVVGTNAMRVQRGKPILGSVSMDIVLDCTCNFIVANYVGVQYSSKAAKPGDASIRRDG